MDSYISCMSAAIHRVSVYRTTREIVFPVAGSVLDCTLVAGQVVVLVDGKVLCRDVRDGTPPGGDAFVEAAVNPEFVRANPSVFSLL